MPKRLGRPKALPDTPRIARAMLRFKEMTRTEKRVFLIQAIEFAPEAGFELMVEIRPRKEDPAA